MEVFLKSDIGLIRSTNQDACTGGVFSGDAAWAVVCDGMGGANGGNIASSVAVKEISRRLKRGYRDSLSDDEIVDLLTEIVQKANSKLYKIQKNDEQLRVWALRWSLFLSSEERFTLFMQVTVVCTQSEAGKLSSLQ